MRVAICDDQSEWTCIIEGYLTKLKNVYSQLSWDVFYSGEELLDYYKREGNVYDIVIMDIELEDMSGIEAAQKIRNADSGVIIFFLTNYKEYVYDCFKPGPANFWLKPVPEDIFFKDMNEAISRNARDNRYLRIIEDRAKMRIRCHTIIYLENKDRKTFIYTLNRVYKTNKLLSDLSLDLDNNQFVRVYKSYIVNLDYVHIIKQNEILLYDCDAVIPIGRSYRKNLNEKYMKFKIRSVFLNGYIHISKLDDRILRILFFIYVIEYICRQKRRNIQ